MELEESGSLTSDYTTKLQSVKQNDTGTKTEIQINRTRQKAQKINPCTYGQLIHDKGGKSIQWKKNNLFNKQAWKNWIATCKQ